MTTEKLVTEPMLNVHYEKNGKVFKELGAAESYLYARSFTKTGDMVYKNHVGQTCRLYTLKDAVFQMGEFIGYKRKGFLVSFGGEPVSGKNLKFSEYK